jgi:hypothetical protein
MTKLSELKRRWINDPEFRKEYEEVDAEYAIIETAATGTRLHMELLPEEDPER